MPEWPEGGKAGPWRLPFRDQGFAKLTTEDLS